MTSSFLKMSLATILLIAPSGSAFGFSAEYNQVIRQGETLIAEFKVQMKGEKLRTESTMGGLFTILIKNDKGAFSYRPEKQMALKIPDEGKPNIMRDIPRYQEYLEGNNAKIVGTETLNGHLCDIYEFDDQATQLPVRVWVISGKHFPIQVIARTPQGTMTVLFNDVQLDLELADSLFELPDDVEIMDIQGFMTPQELPSGDMLTPTEDESEIQV